eukprot:Rhum_TRINITY_DN3147_c0_g1::Rhum_TRINITY_DN3147_c0_g1_i1::g.9747::m.9747/K03105/SRP19; signal recognition particle subunit SRP19
MQQQQQMQLTPEQQAQMQAAAMEQCRVAIAASGIKPQERPDVKDVEGKHYQTIYPQYLDQNLTTHQGRRLPKAKAVPGPMAVEIYKSCEMLGLPVMFEPGKGYSRNSTIRRGRVRVLIKRPKDEHYIKKSDFDEQTRGLLHPEIPSKKFLMEKLGEIIPLLPSRQKQPNMQPPPQQQVIATAQDKKKKKKK